MSKKVDGPELAPCPFCAEPLAIRGGVNPYGRCDTEGCWMHERKMTVVLDDQRQVKQWNTRAAMERKLPCGVTVEPATHFTAGVKVSTLLEALERRARDKQLDRLITESRLNY